MKRYVHVWRSNVLHGGVGECGECDQLNIYHKSFSGQWCMGGSG